MKRKALLTMTVLWGLLGLPAFAGPAQTIVHGPTTRAARGPARPRRIDLPVPRTKAAVGVDGRETIGILSRFSGLPALNRIGVFPPDVRRRAFPGYRKQVRRDRPSIRHPRAPLNTLLDRKTWAIILYRGGAVRFGHAIPRLKLVRYRQKPALTDPGVLAPVVFFDLAGGEF